MASLPPRCSLGYIPVKFWLVIIGHVLPEGLSVGLFSSDGVFGLLGLLHTLAMDSDPPEEVADV
jgi:hypothetical protein